MIVNNSVVFFLLWVFFSPEGKEKKFNGSNSSGPFPSKFDKFFLIDVSLALSLLKFFVNFFHFF